VASTFLIDVRPQIPNQLIATAALVAGDGEERQNGERPLSHDTGRTGSGRIFEREAAQEVQEVHATYLQRLREADRILYRELLDKRRIPGS
jgi:hypothetical protein